MKNIYIDYNQISLSLEALAKEVKKEKFGGIVIVLRGGSFPGIHLAFLTGLPFYYLRYNRSEETISWLGDIPSPMNVLLVEDFAGMGKTLTNCIRFLLEQSFEVKTLVVCKDVKSSSIPNYSCFETKDPNARYILPWERYRINPIADQHSEQERKADDQYYCTMWDHSLSRYAKDGDGIAFPNGNKGDMAIKSGYTHLVLSNVEEAILVSAEYPELSVSWLNGEKYYQISSRETHYG
ncbi:phosphoribosyltransferase [Pseudalkalibacillus hwajinpoensis]|uniref:phosphoribosyltransferase n=1 Tax=Guptibacillus hwajinpoensis TaxID=208199 RepID=UPI001CFD15D9|nr:phosphoribosyltransferase [Pseudalkalibacillus hwajinpoensis]